MIFDATYFVIGELNTPNANNGNAGSPSSSQQSDLDVIIDKYERRILLEYLGAATYLELVTVMQDLDSAAQKWKDLVNGSSYQVSGKTFIWDGLRGVNKDSFIAHYIFCQFLRFDEIKYSTTGMTVLGVKNGVRASYRNRFVISWNEFVNGSQCSEGGTVSFIQYLKDKASDFPLVGDDFSKHEYVNRFGL